MDWVTIDVIGKFGGIVVMWDTNIVDVTDTWFGWHSITVHCRHKGSGFSWVHTVVYGPTKYDEKAEFWEELSDLGVSLDISWCIVGDFNVTRYFRDRNRGR